MALTPGFKKFIGLVVVIGAVGGGLFYWKTMPKKVQQVEVSVEQPAPAPEAPAAANVAQPVYTQPAQQEQAPAQVQQAPSEDASSNRGMAFLLNQGKK